MNPGFPYVQLPGAFRGLLRKASLWEGADHVLSIKGTRFNEEYRRFYYRDIQAFIIEKRPQAGSIGLWIILLTLGGSALLGAMADSPRYSWIAALAIFLLILFRLDLTFRKSCRCSIQTAVSRERLPSLIRLSAANAVIARLSERIATVQGDLPAEIPLIEEEVVAAIRPVDPASPAASIVLNEAARREQRSAAMRGTNYAIGALLVLLLNAVFTFWFSSPRGRSTIVEWFGYSFIAAELIAALISLRYIDGIQALNSLRNFLIGVIILCALRFSISLSLATVYAAFSRPQGVGTLQIVTRYFNNVNGALQMVFAACGLILIFAKWERYRRGESSSI